MISIHQVNSRSTAMCQSSLVRTVLSAAFVLLAGACGPADRGALDQDLGDPEPGGLAVASVTSDFQAFNPVINSALVTMEVINFALFTPLIQYDDNLDVAPYLAESWELDDRGVTMRLRSDVLWHDGQPVTAEDVVFTFDLAKNRETASLLESAYLTMVESATVVDAHTVRFEFAAPHSQPMEAFWWAPVPRHLLEGVPPAQLGQAAFNRQPVGSGPFRFVSWEAGQSVTLEANQQFPAGLGGRPLLDRIVFRIVPESTTRLTELLTGAIDVNYTILPDEAQQVEQARGVEIRSYPSREFVYVGWNNQREPFRDPLVRQALAHAINQQEIIDALMFGFADPAAGPIMPQSPLNPDVDPIPHDLERARALFAQAGFTPGADGILRGPQGQPLRFTLMTSENRLRQDISTVLQQQLRRAGVDLQVRVMEFQTLLQQHRARDYEAVLASWTLDNFRVDPTPLFSCEEAQREGSPNRAGYCNPEADRLMLSGMRETDQGRSREIWRDFNLLLQRDQPITFLYWSEEIAGTAPRLQDAEMDARGKLVNLQRWWIPENRRR
jgi:peptide/nickel transport system substrate-binding protein